MIARQSCKGGKHLFLVRAPSPTDIMQRLQQQQQQQQSRTTNKTWPRSPIAEDSSLARQQLIVVSSSFSFFSRDNKTERLFKSLLIIACPV
jgi:hypothetical protein